MLHRDDSSLPTPEFPPKQHLCCIILESVKNSKIRRSPRMTADDQTSRATLLHTNLNAQIDSIIEPH